MEIGTIVTMKVTQKKEQAYTLEKGIKQYVLPEEETTGDLNPGQEVEVFILKRKVTMQLPKLEVGLFEWVDVCGAESDKIFVDIGISEPIPIHAIDLPAIKSVWPAIGDRLYVTLKYNKEGELFAVPAKERQFNHFIEFCEDVDLNDQIEGTVIRTAREGTVMLTKEGYRAFIHRTEREQEPRLGEMITARVIEVKEDGTLNASLKPLKHKRIKDDAESILNYLIERDGKMPFTDRSKPESIQKAFQMSKSAFKRALGHLMKEGKVEQLKDETILIKNKK